MNTFKKVDPLVMASKTPALFEVEIEEGSES